MQAHLHKLRLVWTENFNTKNDLWIYEKCKPTRGILCSGKAKAYHNRYLTFDMFYQKSTVKVLDSKSIFGLICNNDFEGSIFVVDNCKNTISIHSNFEGDYNIPKVKTVQQLNFEVLENSEYLLEVYKIGWTHSFAVTELSTNKKTSVTFDNTKQPSNPYYCGKGWGAPGIISLSGEVLFRDHHYSCALFPKAKVLFIGDSITEGLDMGQGVGIENRWCNQLTESVFNGDSVICGRSGAVIDDCIHRFNDILALGFKFETVVLLDGMNERSKEGLENWKIKVQSFYDLVITHGAVPIICVNPIPECDEEFLFEMRDFILSKKWKTIRFDLGVSLDNDGITYDGSLFTDGVHPNKIGQDKMFERAIIDLTHM